MKGQLRKAGVRMGILTTRGITDLRANLDDALHLRRIAHSIGLAAAPTW